MTRRSGKAGMEVRQVPITDLVLDDRNARKGDVPAIAASLKELGQHRPVVVQRGTMKVIAGNHMVLAAQTLGWGEIAATFVDDDDDTATRRAIADNATSSSGKWNDDILKGLLEEVGTDVPGLDEKLLARLFKEEEAKPEEPIYPLMPKPGEDYDYVMFWTTNVVESTYLKTLFPQREVQWKYPQSKPVRSRVLPFSVLADLLATSGAVPICPPDETEPRRD